MSEPQERRRLGRMNKNSELHVRVYASLHDEFAAMAGALEMSQSRAANEALRLWVNAQRRMGVKP